MVAPTSHHLQSRVNQIYDHLYANASTRTPAGIAAEVGKVLHAGAYIEASLERKPAFNYDRHVIRALTSQEEHTCRGIARDVRTSFSEMNSRWKFYDQNAELNLSDLNIGFTVAQLSGIYLSDPKRDVFGDVVEIIRSNWAKRVGGQFFTDQRVTSLAMVLLDFDPRRGDDLVDICAGTGGFLLAGMNHIRSLLDEDGNVGIGYIEEELVKLATTSIKGLEVDDEIAALANASLKARLGSKHDSFVRSCDSLNPTAVQGNQAGIRMGTHICAASNPPFGTKITVKDPAILRSYDLSVMAPRSSDMLPFNGFGKLTPRAPDILFLEQNIKLLAPGRGRLAIVMPYQILSGPQTSFVREWLLRHAQILAVVDLPGETFQPHTGTKTALLVVKRRAEPLSDARDEAEGSIFMAMPRWIGHDRRGHPIFKRNADGSAADEILSDFGSVEATYQAYRKGRDPQKVYEHCFAVPYSAISQDPLLRINALFHKPLSGLKSAHQLASGETWERKKIRDVVKKIFYPGRFRRDYVDYKPGAVPFLGGSNITELIATTEKWLGADDPKLNLLRVETGWILITRSGSTGIVSSVPPAWDGCAISEHVIRIIPDPLKLDPHYLLAFLKTRHAQEIIKRGVFGSVIDEITPEFIGDIDILIPKTKKTLAQIVTKVRDAEEARQLAILGHIEGLSQLNLLLE